MADFKYYLNRQGPKGEPGAKGDKGDNGNTPTFSDGINTPTVYTMQIDMGDGNVFETQNLKYPMRDDGGNYLRYDRTNSTVTLSAPNVADLQRTSGEVTLASVDDVENEDAQDTDAVSMELRNADQLALENEIDRIDRDIDTVDDKVDREIQNRQDADTTLSGRIDGLDSSKANKTDVYTKSQTDSLLNNKSNVGHTHNYNDLTNKPVIGNGTITLTQGGITKGTFTTNQSGNSTIELDAGGGGGATYTAGPGITINQNDEISANVDNDTIVIDGNSLKANIPDVSNFVTNTQLASTLTAYPTNNALSNAITYQTISVPTPAIYTFDGTTSPTLWEYSTDPDVETDGEWSKVGTSTYTRDRQLVIPESFLLVNVLPSLETNECVKGRSGYTFSFECNPQVTIGYFDPGSDDNFYNVTIDTNTLSNDVFNVSSSSEGYTTLNIRLLRDIYITSMTVRYNTDSNGHTPSMFLTPFYNLNGEMEVYVKSAGTPVSTTKAVIANTAVDGDTITVDSNGKLVADVNNGTLTVIQGGVTKGTFRANQSSDTTIALDGTPDLSTYVQQSQLNNAVDWVASSPTITETSTTIPVYGGLGFSPVNSGLYSLISEASQWQNYTSAVLAPNDNTLLNSQTYLGINVPTEYGYIKLTISDSIVILKQVSGITVMTDGIGDLWVNMVDSSTGETVYHITEDLFTITDSGTNITCVPKRTCYFKSWYCNYDFTSVPPNNWSPIFQIQKPDSTSASDNFSCTIQISQGSSTAYPKKATASTVGAVKPDGTSITVDSNGVISAVNNSIVKTAPIIPLKYEEQEDGVSTGIGGVLNHTNYTDNADKVYVYDASTTGIYNISGDGYIYQSATNMMSKIFYRGYKIRLDNGLNVAWNIAEGSGYFMNVAIGYYDSGSFVPVLYALNTNSYGGSMFARPALEFGSDVYDMGRLNTQFTSCVGISLVGNVLSAFSPTNGRHTYTISDTTLLTELQKCTHAICTVVNESSTGTTFNYSTGKFANPATTLSDDLEARNTIFSAAENLILNDDVTIIPELKLNYDSTYFKVVNNQLTLDIQAIKDAIDALNNSSGTASQPGDLGTGGWD